MIPTAPACKRGRDIVMAVEVRALQGDEEIALGDLAAVDRNAGRGEIGLRRHRGRGGDLRCCPEDAVMRHPGWSSAAQWRATSLSSKSNFLSPTI